MCHYRLNPYQGLGLNGQHRQAVAASYSDPSFGANHANQGAISQAAAQAMYAQAARVSAAYEPPEDTGIEAGEIIAWRCWQVKDNYTLQSMFTSHFWVPGEAMTGNAMDGAGVHAWKHKMDAVMYGKEDWLNGTGPVVVGQIKLWGEVIEHEDGYRASFGKIVSLDFLLNKWFRRRETVLRKLREKYLEAAR